MKLIRIIQDVTIPGMPAFRKSQQVKVKDSIADILVERGHAKLEKGKSEAKVKNEKAKKAINKAGEKKKNLDVKEGKLDIKADKKKEDVTVTKVKGKTK